MKVAIYTLGCKMNQYESQSMEKMLRERGHEIVDFKDAADAYVINTCSVTAVSDQKSRQVIHRVQKQYPAAVVAVCGCYPQTHVEEVRALGVDLVGGTGTASPFWTCWNRLRRKSSISKPLTSPLSAVSLKSCPPGAKAAAPGPC